VAGCGTLSASPSCQRTRVAGVRKNRERGHLPLAFVRFHVKFGGWLMATAHLIHGYLGAGKTSFARMLEYEVGGIRFSADEWYLRLYAGNEPTARLEPAWWDRVLSMLDGVWPKVLQHGIDVVLDFGFWSRKLRDNARRLALSVGSDAKLYRVICDEEVARARCLARNANPAGTFVIEALGFEALRGKFEPLGSDEPHELIDTTPVSSVKRRV